MSDSPILKRIKYQSATQNAGPSRMLVQRRFGWTVIAKSALQAVALGWFITGLIGCVLQCAPAFSDVPPKDVDLLVFFAVNNLLVSATISVVLMAASEVLYGFACWLAAQDAPESGESLD